MPTGISAQTSSFARRFGLVLLLFVFVGVANAQLNTFTISGAALTTDGTCGGGYLHCYILTVPQVDPLGLTTNATFTKYPVAPTGFVFAATLSMNIRRGTTYNNQAIAIAVDVAPDFTHPTLLTAQSCFTTCTSAASFIDITTTRTTRFNGTEAAAIPLYLDVNVAELNGASAFGGADVATVELRTTSGAQTSTDRIKIQVNNVATALSFKMSYAPGATDYATDFGNVNGFGIGGVTAPATGIYAPGVVYYQSYTITPIFANFNPVSVGYPTISAYVSTVFAPAAAASTLHLCDATAVLGACTVLGTTPATANQLLTSVVNRSTNTRALGLIVQATNGATAFPGTGSRATSAIVTFEITVQ